MLPDYPEFKKECAEIVRERLVQVRDNCVSPFGSNNDAANHVEGDKFEVIRADGSGESASYNRVEENFSFTNDELEKLTLDQLLDKYSQVGESMGHQQFGIMLNALSVAVEGTSNDVKASGGNLVEQIFESLEKIHLDFDANGQPNQLQTIAAPQMAKRLKAAHEKIDNDPKLKKRHDDLIDRKREEFRDREASRKLVD